MATRNSKEKGHMERLQNQKGSGQQTAGKRGSTDGNKQNPGYQRSNHQKGKSGSHGGNR